MLRIVAAGLGRAVTKEVQRFACRVAPSIKLVPQLIQTQTQRNLSLALTQPQLLLRTDLSATSSLLPSTLIQCLGPLISQSRTVTKFSLRKGKRKSVKAVIKRFKRLHWGGWIRTRSGRHKKLWKKSKALKRRLKQHVLVNGAQSFLLDKMVTQYWRRPKYYVDDPYEPYHTREEYYVTRTKPQNFK